MRRSALRVRERELEPRDHLLAAVLRQAVWDVTGYARGVLKLQKRESRRSTGNPGYSISTTDVQSAVVLLNEFWGTAMPKELRLAADKALRTPEREQKAC
ncbi:MAG: hypothetical protein ACPLPR_08625 [Bacillota bacterium]